MKVVVSFWSSNIFETVRAATCMLQKGIFYSNELNEEKTCLNINLKEDHPVITTISSGLLWFNGLRGENHFENLTTEQTSRRRTPSDDNVFELDTE